MNLHQLIKDARHGNAAAQKCLFDRYVSRLELVCRRYVKVKEDAEEVLLDGFFKFFKALNNFEYRDEASLYQWLKTIMVNQSLMFLRKKKSFTLVTESSAEEIPLQEEALNRLTAQEIFQLILQLPVGYRTVFNLYAVEGMSHQEIASALDISEGTSKSQLSKAKLALQNLLIEKENSYAIRKQNGK